MRQMVLEYMKKIGIEDHQIQNSMMLVRKVMMEYVNEMEISEESIKKLENYSVEIYDFIFKYWPR